MNLQKKIDFSNIEQKSILSRRLFGTIDFENFDIDFP